MHSLKRINFDRLSCLENHLFSKQTADSQSTHRSIHLPSFYGSLVHYQPTGWFALAGNTNQREPQVQRG